MRNAERPACIHPSARFALLAAALLAGPLACGALHDPGADPGGGPGTLTLALRTEANGRIYRLSAATFEVTGPEPATLDTNTEADGPAIRRSLRAGSYRVELVGGWRLERSTDSGGTFADAPAMLTSPNPQSFTITPGHTSAVGFQFRIPGAGDLELSIAVIDESLADGGAPATDAAPPPVSTSGVADLAIGFSQTCAVVGDGRVRCWGYGANGQLGYGNTTTVGDDETPASAGDVVLGGAATQLTAGRDRTCALLASGHVRCWGSGELGFLGYGNFTTIGDDETPASAGDIDVGGPVAQIAAGQEHTCALLRGGTVRCWGAAALGYGNSNTIGDDEAPASAGDVDVGGPVLQIAAGAYHTCALLESGAVRCWGELGFVGMLGYGNTESIGDNEPPASAGDVDVGGLVTQVVAGMFHTCALLASGAVRCWGQNDTGQLGYAHGRTIGDDEPPSSAGDVDLGGRAAALAAGANFTCALLTSATVRCWGSSFFGNLGYGNTSTIGDDETPASAGDVNVGGPVTKIRASAVGSHVCALLASGTVRCWGCGGNGRLGYGSTADVGDNEQPFTAGDVPIFDSAGHP